jgi:hypothetical protein
MTRYRIADEAGVRVMAERCPTCIFRPGNLMHLQPGRVRDMVAEVKRREGCIPCHATFDDDVQAICRGQFDTVKTQPIQVAERLGLIVWHVRDAS